MLVVKPPEFVSCERLTGMMLLGLLLLAGSGCKPSTKPQVICFVALDREFSSPILEDFERQTGVHVLVKFDVESTKTVGLTTAIINERARPRCDIFWNNEILHTLRLQKLGLLEPFFPANGREWPKNYKAADGSWHGLAGRARVLIVNKDLVPQAERPTSINDLVDPKWKGKIGIAKPLFGTTATHAAVLFSVWEEAGAKKFFVDLESNARVMSGNKQVAVDVAEGRLLWGLTDTDDAIIERDKGAPVEIVFPDQKPGELGTL